MTSFASHPHSGTVFRDPVLVLPVAVVAAIAVGWLGADAAAPGTRIAVDVALAWAFVGASLVALERARWRRSRILLTASGFAVLVADLHWAQSDGPWTLGLVLEALWVALFAEFVLTFPGGRPWSRLTTAAITSAYVAAAAQLLAALVDDRPRNLIVIAGSQRLHDLVGRTQAALGFAVAVTALALVLWRLLSLHGTPLRSQGPLLAGAALAVPAAAFWLADVAVTGEGSTRVETLARAIALLVPLGLVAGVAWARMHRSEASELVVEVHTEGAASLDERLARALGDPTLAVAYRLDDGRYVDGGGEPFEIPHDLRRAVTPVTVQGEEVAILVHHPALLDEPGLVESVRATAGLVLENERLAAEVRAQLAEVRASRARIIAATDAERRRIERDLHDGAQQRLVTISVSLGLAASRVDAAQADMLSRAQEELEHAIGELRELARGIHPTLLREEGLAAAVQGLARRAPLPVDVESSPGGVLPQDVELAAYFVVSEALTNVAKHAEAQHASVRLVREGDLLHVVVSDDGHGGARFTPGSGLAGLRDRLQALDAELTLENEPGRGTSVRAVFPCAS
jgi:signal transduction histidine kinase